MWRNKSPLSKIFFFLLEAKYLSDHPRRSLLIVSTSSCVCVLLYIYDGR